MHACREAEPKCHKQQAQHTKVVVNEKLIYQHGLKHVAHDTGDTGAACNVVQLHTVNAMPTVRLLSRSG